MSINTVKKYMIPEKLSSSVIHDFNRNEFKTNIVELLVKRGSLKKQTAEALLDDEGIDFLKVAFTHPSLLLLPNNKETMSYELYETLGDVTLNKCVVWYVYRRFPALKYDPDGPELITELKKEEISKKHFSKHLDTLGLTKFIRYAEIAYMFKEIEKKVLIDNSMKEDVFEAFMGALEELIDGRIMPGTGYPIIYNIVCSIFDNIKIELDISKIIDPITKLNEIFNLRKKIGDSYKITKKLDINNAWVATIEVILSGSKYMIQGDPSTIKAQISEISAATKTLEFLKKKGIEWSRKSVK